MQLMDKPCSRHLSCTLQACAVVVATDPQRIGRIHSQVPIAPAARKGCQKQGQQVIGDGSVFEIKPSVHPPAQGHSPAQRSGLQG